MAPFPLVVIAHAWLVGATPAPRALVVEGGCVDAAALAASLRARLGDDAIALPDDPPGAAPAHRLRVVAKEDADGKRATVSADDVEGERAVGPTADCASLTEQVAVLSAVFLATLQEEARAQEAEAASTLGPPAVAPPTVVPSPVAPTVTTSTAPSRTSVAPPTTPAALAPPIVEATLPAPVKPPPATRVEAALPWRVSTTIGLGAQGGRGPQLGPRASVGVVALAPNGGWSTELGLVVDGAIGAPLPGGTVAPDARATVVAAALVPAACVRAVDVVSLCALVELGAAWGQGFGVPGATGGLAPQLAPGASVGVLLPIVDGFVLDARAAVSVPVLRMVLRDSGTGAPLYTQAPAVVGASIGTAFSL